MKQMFIVLFTIKKASTDEKIILWAFNEFIIFYWSAISENSVVTSEALRKKK